MSARDPLNGEQREIRELVRTIARERIAPRAAEIDKSAEFPWDVVELYRENDLFGIMYDEAYGGIGESSLMTLVAIEELSKVCATSDIFFNDCRIPAANLLGDEGGGFKIAMRILDRSRPGIGAQGLGLAQGATDYALEYARSRETMGKPIAQHQLIAGMLADMETKCEVARGLLYKVGQMIDEGDTGTELTKLSAMAKLYCTDVAMDVTTDAVQVLGGYGYIQEYPVERMMRDAKITQIYEGTNQIQRLVIAREMLKENRAFLLAGVG